MLLFAQETKARFLKQIRSLTRFLTLNISREKHVNMKGFINVPVAVKK